ncbi:hypothetical protein PRJ_2166 [Pseudomonas sp. XWY-1]|nr:hypothetical protein PRJ_2166 [Pseudomonas sp. XWY-1]
MPPPPYSRVHTHRGLVGAGSPAKGPGLLANFHPPITGCRHHRIRG